MANLFVVTGGAGFIGRNIVAALNERGEDDILIVDRLGTDEKWKNLLGLKFDDFIDIDDFRAGINAGALKDVKTVFHMGACSDTTERDADYLLDNNYSYSCDLCSWCVENGIRFIYASSAATYGDGRRGYSDDEDGLDELRPLNMYGYSKQLFDLWAARNGLLDRIAGLKYFNVYGPYEDHKGDMRSVVHKAYGQILETGSGGLFNCGTGQARSWIDLARAVFAAMEREPDIRFIDMPEHLRAKYQYFTEARMDKIRACGFDHQPLSLEDGVRDYVVGHLAR